MSLKFSFTKIKDIQGKHALFSPSQPAWLRYDEDKIIDRIINQYRAALGTEMHEFAASQIILGHKLGSAKSVKNEIENYIYGKYTKLNEDETGNSECSERGMKLIRHVSDLPKEVFETVKFYVNDAVGFKMIPEQELQYCDVVFGTADAIMFRGNQLRIHDLKTGSMPVHMEQLMVYAAITCLQYNIKPSEIEIELRLYQSDGIVVHNPSLDDIVPIMDKIVTINKIALGIEKERGYE